MAEEEKEVEAPTSAVADEAEAEAGVDKAAPAEPEVQLSPKERRQASRTKRSAKTAPRVAVTPEDRQAERDAVRAKKAASRRVERAAARAKYKASEHERRPTPAREHVAGIQKTRQGVVISDRADKTITIRIDIARRHRRYEKIVRTSNTVHAHDERNDAHIGDTVIVRESRPLSRTKRWRLVEVVERAG
jgi:small subunit ribosomal protein S17